MAPRQPGHRPGPAGPPAPLNPSRDASQSSLTPDARRGQHPLALSTPGRLEPGLRDPGPDDHWSADRISVGRWTNLERWRHRLIQWRSLYPALQDEQRRGLCRALRSRQQCRHAARLRSPAGQLRDPGCPGAAFPSHRVARHLPALLGGAEQCGQLRESRLCPQSRPQKTPVSMCCRI